MLNKEQCNQLL